MQCYCGFLSACWTPEPPDLCCCFSEAGQPLSYYTMWQEPSFRSVWFSASRLREGRLREGKGRSSSLKTIPRSKIKEKDHNTITCNNKQFIGSWGIAVFFWNFLKQKKMWKIVVIFGFLIAQIWGKHTNGNDLLSLWSSSMEPKI